MIDRFSWMAIYPEIVLLAMACVITLVDLLDRGQRRMAAYWLSCLTLVVLVVLTAMYAMNGQTVYGFGGMVVSDVMANWLKCFSAVAVLVIFIYSRTYVTERGMLRGAEWYDFDPHSGRIAEIRAYYAAPADKAVRINELVDFDYAGRGYPLRSA